MAIYVDFNKVLGSVEVKANNGKFYKCDICKANCLMAIIYTDDEGNKQLWGFFHDLAHMKRAFKDSRYFNFLNGYRKWKLNFNHKEFHSVIKLLVNCGLKVEVFGGEK